MPPVSVEVGLFGHLKAVAGIGGNQIGLAEGTRRVVELLRGA